MTHIPPAGTWNREASSRIAEVARQVATTSEPELLGREHIRFDCLENDAARAIDSIAAKGRIARDRTIYVFELDDETTAQDVQEAFSEARSDRSRKLPQFNHSETSTMYVGSSCATKMRTDTLRNRLRQHLISAPTGTYALRLGEWIRGLSGGLYVNAWQYPQINQGDAGDRLARQTVLIVEDWLAERLQPMFGCRGSRN